jgi:hypothetical protein
MSNLTLVRRGTISATSADGAGPKDSSAFAAVKPNSSFVVATVRDRRQNKSVQRGVVTVSEAGTSPQNVAITAVDLACAHVVVSVRENRDGNARGIVAHLTSSTNLRIEFYGTVDAGENIDVRWEVIEDKPRRGATVRLLSATVARLEWDGTLQDGETIDCFFEVFDLDDEVDQLLELDYKLVRLLGYAGENSLVDLHSYNQAGNMDQFRVRVFDTAVNMNNATVDLPEGEALETGEKSRALVTIEWDPATNRRKTIYRETTALAATPGIS